MIWNKEENIVGKKENIIQHYAFRNFIKVCKTPEWEDLTHSHTMTPFDAPEKQVF